MAMADPTIMAILTLDPIITGPIMDRPIRSFRFSHSLGGDGATA